MDELTLIEKCFRFPYCVIRFLIVILMNVYCLPTYVIWMTTLLPLKRFQPDLFYYIEGIFYDWLLSVVASWPWSAGYEIIELGDDIRECMNNKNSRTLILANHQSTADVPLMMASFSNKPGVLPNLMWIMDRIFKFTNFGIVSIIHQDFFIASGKDNRNESVRRLKDHLVESFIPRNRQFLVLFPEGGFLRKRRHVSQLYAQKNNLPVLQNVTLPRVGAINAVMESLQPRSLTEPNCRLVKDVDDRQAINNNSVGEEVSPPSTVNGCSNLKPNSTISNGGIRTNQAKSISLTDLKEKSSMDQFKVSNYLDYILDITIAYEDGKPLDLWNVIHGYRFPCQTHFVYRLYKTENIPHDPENFSKWLYDRWQEKEVLLDNFYTNKRFNLPDLKTRIVEHDLLRFVVINLFFMASSYLHLQLFYLFYK